MLDIKLYQRDPTSTALEADITALVDKLRFGSRLHGGFHICNFRLRADMAQAWSWITDKLFRRITISDNKRVIWEGRIEDISMTAGEVGVTAYGFYSHLSDQPYSTAYNTTADAIIKAALTAVCPKINSDQSNIAATNITITSAAGDDYLDLNVQELVEKMLDFSDSTSKRWYFAIWENRVPYLKARSAGAITWQVTLKDFVQFKLAYRGKDLWNNVYAIYTAAGSLTRTAEAQNTDSQTKYGYLRKKAIPQLGSVAAAAAEAQRNGWLAEYKDIWPRLTNMTLGAFVRDSNNQIYPSYWIRAGDVIRVNDLVPASVDAGSVERDALRTFYIVEAEYDADKGTCRIIPDTENSKLSTIIAKKL